MSINDLRKVYGGNKKASQAVNAAVRAEIPGGAEILEATHWMRKHFPNISDDAEMDFVYKKLVSAAEKMKRSIAKKYQLKTYGDNYDEYDDENATG
ncbi:MAG: hypothetical protein LBT05_01790 [Planctomycetaceae bacterium]|jgi:hypothetical protein|nr:hypothetical protein [Planctomycetaceae bacterium]